MPSPFPGMDPYLEHPGIWPGVHLLLIATLAETLNRKLPRNYWTAIQERKFIEEFGDLRLVGIRYASVAARERAAPRSGAAVAERTGRLRVKLPQRYNP